MHFKSYTKSRNRINVTNVRRNLVPNAWTTDREGTLPKLSLCSHDNCCIGHKGMEFALTG